MWSIIIQLSGGALMLEGEVLGCKLLMNGLQQQFTVSKFILCSVRNHFLIAIIFYLWTFTYELVLFCLLWFFSILWTVWLLISPVVRENKVMDQNENVQHTADLGIIWLDWQWKMQHSLIVRTWKFCCSIKSYPFGVNQCSM